MANFKVNDFFNGTCNANNIYGTRVFSTSDWQQFGNDVNHLIGRGRQLLPISSVDVAATNTSSPTLAFAIAPSEHTTKLLWTISYLCDVAGNELVQLNITQSNNAATVSTLYLNATQLTNVEQTAIVYQNLSNPRQNIGNGVLTGSIQVLKTNGAQMLITNISCYEIPRNILNPITYSFDYGVDLDSFRYRAGLFDSGLSTTYSSIKGLARNVLKAEHRNKRALYAGMGTYLNNNTVNYNNALFSLFSTGPTPVNPFTSTGFPNPKFVARKRYENENSGSLLVCALVGTSGSATGNLYLTGSNGVVASIPITSSTPAWGFANLTWHTDDYNYANTFPNGVLPEFNCRISGSFGANSSIHVFSMFVIDPDTTFSSSF